MIEFINLTKRYGKFTAVDQLTLQVPEQRALALWGANGAGKTTVIKCILGLHRCAGDIRIRGRDARRDGKEARRQIGYVSQELALYDDLTARESLRFFAELRAVDRQRIDVVLHEVGLAEHAGKRVAALSGGMKQRLALAVALLSDPPLLLLDEPTSNLDAAARRAFLCLLGDLKRAGKTILFTTHRADEVVQLADRLVILERGRVGFDGDVSGLERTAAAWTTLRIPLPEEARRTAAGLLKAAGLEVSQNHAALLVRVAATRKAVPLALLARSGIAVEDVDFDT